VTIYDRFLWNWKSC